MNKVILYLLFVFTTFNAFSQEVYIPKQFMPIGDGFEDTFVINTNGVPFSYKIYARTGEEIFSAPSGQFWDGTTNGIGCPNGVYLVIVEIYYPTGTVLKKQVVDIMR